MSGQIFISYRREESRWSARTLYDRLATRFDRKQIFMDVDAVAPGENFLKAIEKWVGECDVLIAVIGARWLTSVDEQGACRLHNPEDFVRMEIATALQRDITVIPVLVDGALMPRSADLSDDLKPLVYRNALQVGDTHFDDDCRRLVAAIEQILEPIATSQREQREKGLSERGKPGAGGKRPSKLVTAFLVIAVCAGLIYILIRLSQAPQPQAAPVTTATPRPSVIATPIVEEKASPTPELAVDPSIPYATPAASSIVAESTIAPHAAVVKKSPPSNFGRISHVDNTLKPDLPSNTRTNN